MEARDVVVCAAGSLPGDLHGMWRTRDRKGYHVEYGFSCMGYEIPGGIGVRMAAPDRDVFITVGDGSYLMMPTELVTAVQEGIKVIVVLLQNHGYASIGSLAESLGVQRFGTKYRYRNADSGRLDGGILPVDLAANAESLGIKVYRAKTLDELREALKQAKAGDEPAMVHVDTDLEHQSPSGDGWWDVPVADVSTLDFTQQAKVAYDKHKATQRSTTAPPAADPARFPSAPPHLPGGPMTTITDPDALPEAADRPSTAATTPAVVSHWSNGAPFAGELRPHRAGVRPGDRQGHQARRAGLREGRGGCHFGRRRGGPRVGCAVAGPPHPGAVQVP